MASAKPLNGRAADFRAATVKIHSRSDAGLIEFRGSGTLFGEAGRCYVLTSDHVVLHAEKGHRHWIEGAVSATAHFLAADWERGLALLEVEGKNCGSLTAADLAPGESTKDPVGVFGFPWDVTERMDCVDGRITNPAEPSELFVAVPALARVEGCHGEFGMSGGPTSVGAKFLGVLSHQKLLDAGSDVDTLLIIPAAVSYPWMRAVLNAPASYRYALIQTPQIQLEKREEVVSQNVWFSIGRYLSLDPGRREVCASEWSQSYTPLPYADPGGYFARMKGYGDKGCVYIVGFRERKFLGKAVGGFASLVGFFRQFARADRQPIVLLPGAGRPGDSHAPLVRAIHDSGCRSHFGPLCTALREIADRIEPPPHATGTVTTWSVTPDDITHAVEGAELAEEWKSLSHPAELRAILTTLRAVLATVTL